MKIMFVGDLNLGEYYTSFGHGPRSFAKFRSVFSKVQPIFDNADLLIGNLEAPITNRKTHDSESESMVLRVEPKHSFQLLKAGFGILQVANNHSVQHTGDGFNDTIAHLKNFDIKPVGKHLQKPVKIICDGVSYGFMAASDVPDNTDKQQTQYQRLDEAFLNQIKAEAGNFDHFIVLLHWGLEASTSPLPYQRILSERLHKLGVRAVIGSHPHLFYEIEKKKDFVCAYSLGNFVFDLCWDSRMTKSGILELDFSNDKMKVILHPVEIKKNGCLPTPSGSPKLISTSVTPYNLGEKMDYQQTRKFIYFILNLLKGNTLLKLRFFLDKVGRTTQKIKRALCLQK